MFFFLFQPVTSGCHHVLEAAKVDRRATDRLYVGGGGGRRTRPSKQARPPKKHQTSKQTTSYVGYSPVTGEHVGREREKIRERKREREKERELAFQIARVRYGHYCCGIGRENVFTWRPKTNIAPAAAAAAAAV
jgi:hypothetical protein